MFNWFYALIGFSIGWAGGAAKASQKRCAENSGFQGLIGLIFIGFLIFSLTFGIEWFFMALIEVFIGAVVGIKMTK